MSQVKSRVLIVDDSAVVREVLSGLVTSDPDLELLGTAQDPVFALEKMKRAWPDVIVLDIEMPRMDGITFLRKIASNRPTPVVICSALAEKNAGVTLEALSLGAVEIITKPRFGIKDYLNDSATVILDAIKAAARVSPSRLYRAAPVAGAPSLLAPSPRPDRPTQGWIVLGASTGGTLAIESILTSLPPDVPPVLIVQHMPEKFTRAFADRLNQKTRIQVKEAEDGDIMTPGKALIAPGNRHMRMTSGPRIEIFDGDLVNRHRPSVDVLFESAAERPDARDGMGMILTGMGGDGARGLLHLRDKGAYTVGQDEATSVVYGMPAEAAKLGAVVQVLPLEAMAQAMVEYGRRASRKEG